MSSYPEFSRIGVVRLSLLSSGRRPDDVERFRGLARHCGPEETHLSLTAEILIPRCMMALNIKDSATEKSVRDLATLTGESITAAIRKAAEERLERVRRQRQGRRLADELLEIGKRCASLPDLDTRTADQILGYDEHGLPR